ncbi:MAG: hypothetical protein R3240_03745 [Gammaproteobacteria bacterium]|nr:hypothetical protein [Gammaproteobacteria bacterium]
MIIYQLHPVHGRNMPVTKMEADLNEEKGWKTVTEEEFYAGIKEVNKKAWPGADELRDAIDDEALHSVLEESNEEIPRAVLEDLYVAKFGKTPHHRMADATIKAKLEEE